MVRGRSENHDVLGCQWQGHKRQHWRIYFDAYADVIGRPGTFAN